MKQHGSKYFSHSPPIPPTLWGQIFAFPLTLGRGQKVKIQLSQNMVMLHIKLNGIANAATCNTYSLLTHTRDPWGGVKGQTIFTLKVVMLHIKLEGGMEHRALYKHMFCPYTHPRPPVVGLKSKHFFLKVVMLHVKLKEMGHRAHRKHIFCPFRPPRPPVVGSKVKTFFSESSHVAYQIKGNGA